MNINRTMILADFDVPIVKINGLAWTGLLNVKVLIFR
jgi:hypothetical protein